MKGEKADNLICIKIVLLIKAKQIQCKLSTVMNHLAVCLTYRKTQNFEPVIRSVHFNGNVSYQWNAFAVSLV